MHKLDVVHGNLKIVRPLLHPHTGHALTFVQRNILVDVGGHARLAGLGVACLPPATPTVDVDRFFHGAAPELVDPRRFGLTDTGATKDSDMYAFGVLTWEVGCALEWINGQLLTDVGSFRRFLLGESRSLKRVGSQGSTRC